MQEIVQLYDALATTSDRDFYRIEADFFMLLQRIPDAKKTDAVVTFLTISNWKGTSLRSGVWTFYESAQQKDLQTTSAYLINDGQIELAEVFTITRIRCMQRILTTPVNGWMKRMRLTIGFPHMRIGWMHGCVTCFYITEKQL